MGEYAAPTARPDASDMRIAIVAARFNDHLTRSLLEGALAMLAELGHAPEPAVHWVPGAFEIPIVAQRVAGAGAVDAVICLGAIVRGGTPHFEYVAGPCADGCARVALDTGVPVIFGVLTTDDEQQALERTGGSEGNKGCEAATTAVETVAELRRITASSPSRTGDG
jgi:6,7-dimethyl-8-ribityllumazine synthase